MQYYTAPLYALCAEREGQVQFERLIGFPHEESAYTVVTVPRITGSDHPVISFKCVECQREFIASRNLRLSTMVYNDHLAEAHPASHWKEVLRLNAARVAAVQIGRKGVWFNGSGDRRSHFQNNPADLDPYILCPVAELVMRHRDGSTSVHWGKVLTEADLWVSAETALYYELILRGLEGKESPDARSERTRFECELGQLRYREQCLLRAQLPPPKSNATFEPSGEAPTEQSREQRSAIELDAQWSVRASCAFELCAALPPGQQPRPQGSFGSCDDLFALFDSDSHREQVWDYLQCCLPELRARAFVESLFFPKVQPFLAARLGATGLGAREAVAQLLTNEESAARAWAVVREAVHDAGFDPVVLL